jgi:hypothetical protein
VISIDQRDTALGVFYGRIVFRVGTGKALVVTCRKLAIAFYNVITQGAEYIDQGKERYLKRQDEREKRMLINLANKYNMQVDRRRLYLIGYWGGTFLFIRRRTKLLTGLNHKEGIFSNSLFIGFNRY